MTGSSIDDTIAATVAWIQQDRAQEQLPPVPLNADTALLDEGIFDSMKVLQFVAWLEETFAIVIGVEALTPAFFASPRTVAEGVAALQARAAQDN